MDGRTSPGTNLDTVRRHNLAAVLGLYMIWKIIRTPGEL